jgi:hypothetical protein
MRGLRRDAEGSQGAETVGEAQDFSHRFRMRGVGQGYILHASSTSAGPPILYRRIRPVSGNESREMLGIMDQLRYNGLDHSPATEA